MRKLLFRTAAGVIGLLFLSLPLFDGQQRPLLFRISMAVIGVAFLLYSAVGNDLAERWLNLFFHTRPTEIVDPTRKPNGPQP